jgi:hypothetical protein
LLRTRIERQQSANCPDVGECERWKCWKAKCSNMILTGMIERGSRDSGTTFVKMVSWPEATCFYLPILLLSLSDRAIEL